MNLIILTEKDSSGNGRYIVNDHRARHIIDILKPEPGDTVEIGFVNGPIGTAIVEKINKAEKSEVILYPEILERPPEIKPDIILVCALPRPQTVKKVLAISATVGIREIHFIRSNRVEKSFFHSPLLEDNNLRSHLLEGLAQGKLTRLPNVTIHNRFKPFFEDYLPSQIDPDAVKLLPEPSVDNYLASINITLDTPLVIAIGPEGGWVPYEIDLMEQHGFRKFKLTESILRVEQAVMAVTAQIELQLKG